MSYLFIIQLARKDTVVADFYNQYWHKRTMSYEEMLERIIIHLSEKITNLESKINEIH